MTRELTTSLLLAVLALAGLSMAAGLLGATGAARADTSGVGLSYDGQHWAAHLSRPLFDPRVRWVPGDVRTARFYVRDSGPTAADLSVQVTRPARTALFGDGDLHITARSGTGPWADVTPGATRTLRQGSGDDLARGASVPVQIRAALPYADRNPSMTLSADLDVRVVLSDARAGDTLQATVPGDGSQTATGPLPNTGSPLRPWSVPLASLLLGGGTFLVLRHRRTTHQEPPQ